MKKTRGPDHIREHLEKAGHRHHYMNYAQGAHYYELPYWSFMNLAKDEGATVVLHKTAIAYIPLIDKYLDENCLVVAEKTNKKESERERMKRAKDIEKLRQQMNDGTKRWVRYDEGAELYSVGLHTFQKIAKDAKAAYKVGTIVLVDTRKVDEFIMELNVDEEDF